MPNLVNRLVAAQYGKDFAQAGGLLVVSVGRVTVEEAEPLRDALAKGGTRLRVVRNSLASRALAECGYEFPPGVFAGNVAVVWGSAEAVIQAAKTLSTPEVRKAGKIAIRGGVLEQSQLSADDARALAGVPDKATVRAQLAGCIQAPLRGLVTALNGLPAGVARLVQARLDAQGGSEAGAPAA